MSRYDLSEFEWVMIKPILPLKDLKNRRIEIKIIVDGIFYKLRTGNAWCDIPERYGDFQACYKLFKKWEKNGTWDRIMDRLCESHTLDRIADNGNKVPVECDLD